MATRFEDSRILVQNDEDEEIQCAWHGESDPEGTHGICEKCEFQVYGKWQMSKVPSYVERFKEKREKW